MAQDFQQAKDDIAYIKGFVGENGRAPVAVAHFYLLIGIVFSIAAVREFCLDIGWKMPGLLTAYRPWDVLGLFLIGFGIGSTHMWRQGQWAPDNPEDLNPASRAALSAWGAVSLAVIVGGFSLWLSTGVEILLAPVLILFAVCYSVGWSVTHAVHRVGWHRLVACGFIVWAVAIGMGAGSPWLKLVIAFGLILLFGVPGYRILREVAEARQAGIRN